MEKRIGLVLSGGGVRGIAHAGLMDALTEEGITVDCISGVSAGALVGALYASGHSTGDMNAFFKEIPIFQLQHYSGKKPGLFDSESYYDLLKPYWPEDDFGALNGLAKKRGAFEALNCPPETELAKSRKLA